VFGGLFIYFHSQYLPSFLPRVKQAKTTATALKKIGSVAIG
jgi:hypothetical protein